MCEARERAATARRGCVGSAAPVSRRCRPASRPTRDTRIPHRARRRRALRRVHSGARVSSARHGRRHQGAAPARGLPLEAADVKVRPRLLSRPGTRRGASCLMLPIPTPTFPTGQRPARQRGRSASSSRRTASSSTTRADRRRRRSSTRSPRCAQPSGARTSPLRAPRPRLLTPSPPPRPPRPPAPSGHHPARRLQGRAVDVGREEVRPQDHARGLRGGQAAAHRRGHGGGAGAVAQGRRGLLARHDGERAARRRHD